MVVKTFEVVDNLVEEAANLAIEVAVGFCYESYNIIVVILMRMRIEKSNRKG